MKLGGNIWCWRRGDAKPRISVRYPYLYLWNRRKILLKKKMYQKLERNCRFLTLTKKFTIKKTKQNFMQKKNSVLTLFQIVLRTNTYKLCRCDYRKKLYIDYTRISCDATVDKSWPRRKYLGKIPRSTQWNATIEDRSILEKYLVVHSETQPLKTDVSWINSLY